MNKHFLAAVAAPSSFCPGAHTPLIPCERPRLQAVGQMSCRLTSWRQRMSSPRRRTEPCGAAWQKAPSINSKLSWCAHIFTRFRSSSSTVIFGGRLHGAQIPGLAQLQAAEPGQISIDCWEVAGGAKLTYRTGDPKLVSSYTFGSRRSFRTTRPIRCPVINTRTAARRQGSASLPAALVPLLLP